MINWVFDLDLTLYELKGDIFSYDKMIYPKNLGKRIKNLPGRKVMFTNGNLEHSLRCINLLNLKKVFHKVLCRELTGFKPSVNSYILAYHYTGMNQNEKTIFFEDTVVNLEMSKKFGWITVLIKKNPSDYEKFNKRVDYHFNNITEAFNYFEKNGI
jgi:FMN phosphatase YigB (HAD superfamily)